MKNINKINIKINKISIISLSTWTRIYKRKNTIEEHGGKQIKTIEDQRQKQFEALRNLNSFPKSDFHYKKTLNQKGN